MPDALYQVWINDDNKRQLKKAAEYLNKRFPDVLYIREHASYDDVMDTLVDGGYIEWSSSYTTDSSILTPDLIIQDYIFSSTASAGKKNCLQTLEKIVKLFPSAKVIISTTEENFEEIKTMLYENQMNFPVTGKISYGRNQLIEEIIASELKGRGYHFPNMR